MNAQLFIIVSLLIKLSCCVELTGKASGENKTDLSFRVEATVTEQITNPSFKFFKKIDPYNCTNQTFCTDLVPFKAWHIIQELQTAAFIIDPAFPKSVNASSIKYAFFIYLVEIYDSKGVFVSSNTWEYFLENHDRPNKWNFPLWSILTIVGIIGATIATIIIIYIKTRKAVPKRIVAPSINIPEAPHILIEPIESAKPPEIALAIPDNSFTPVISEVKDFPPKSDITKLEPEQLNSISVPFENFGDKISISQVEEKLPPRLFDYKYNEVYANTE
jgi:hypothetical protein